MAASPEERSWIRRRAPYVAAAVAASLLALAGTWTWGRFIPGPGPGTEELEVTAGQTDAIMRRTEVAFSDAQGVWERAVTSGTGRSYVPAKATYFSRATTTPCAVGTPVSGPFYCADNATAAFDLAFLANLSNRLQRNSDLGLALVAARVSAEHMQRETGMLDAAALRLIGAGRGQRSSVGTALALQADCLTGLWAKSATKRLGPVPDAFWGELVFSWRNQVEDLAARGEQIPGEFDIFAQGSQDDRKAAFARGYAGRGLSACPAPAEIVARG